MSSTDVNLSPSKTLNDWSERLRIRQIISLLDRPRAMSIALLMVLLVAAWFRFHGLNWDEGRHLHPDERFLSTVTNDLKWPRNLDTYFDPATSTLSPYTLPNMGLYVYGTLPVYAVKWIAILLDRDNYDEITILGRAMSGLFDIGTIFFLFLIGRRLYGKKVGLLAAGLLSLSVLNIQLSHFYAVDTFANLFVVGTIYFLLRAYTSGRWIDHALIGLMFGLGLASKLNVITLGVPILLGAGLNLYQRSRDGDARAVFEHTLVRLLTVFFVAMLTFRVIQPIAFSGPNFLDWSLNPRWLRDISEQQRTLSGLADLPWIQQWTNRSILFPLYNILVWGMGVPLGLASLSGFGLATFELLRYRKLEHLLLVVYVAVTFIYHDVMFVKFMRYFLPIYPFLVLFAAYLIMWLWRRASTSNARSVEALEPEAPSKRWQYTLSRMQLSRQLVLIVVGLVVGSTLIYAMAFNAIYGKMNTRISASRWMYQNIPHGSTLANEHWDDWLPIGGLDGKTSYGDEGIFKSVEMANYEDDTPDKLDRMVDNLSNADYVVLSSNRLYDSIPRLPSRYPMTSRYYELLFTGKLGFERIAEFTSYPTFLGLQLPDQIAEESFTVYDHPRVQIFKKTAAFDSARVRQQLSQGIVWESVVHLTPRQATVSSKTLQFSREDQALYQRTATWSSSEVSEGSWGSRLPVLAWFVVLQIIGLLALPLTMVVFKRLTDRGYIFSKAIGLLIVTWGVWMIASLRIAPFTWWTVLTVMAFVMFASALLISQQQWTELLSFVRNHWRPVLLQEALFWIFFALLLAIRWRNPDLWHPGMGGEKPMDLAYLTAIVHTPYFPSYDPWFAGGYINYYYFGFVLVATLIHLTGMLPTIAYNLAVPTFFAMTAMGGFTVALNFAQSRWKESRDGNKRWLGVGRAALLAGLGGALFVAVIGNLGQIQLLWDGVRNLSSIKADGNASLLVILAQFMEGLNQLMSGQKLSFNTEWWYWNATRVIPPGQGEAGPINEMPFFTFLFGDLHAHMLALPYTLLVLGLGLNVVRNSFRVAASESSVAWWRDSTEMLTLALLALTIGALWPTNTWDFPTYATLTVAALACREYARRGRVDMPGIWAVVWRAALIVVAGRLLFLPFHQKYATAYFGAELWKGSGTQLWAYLLIHGFFLFVLTSYLVAELLKGHGHNVLVRSLRLNLRYWRRRRHIQQLFNHLTQPTPNYHLIVDISLFISTMIIVVLLFKPVIGLALALILLTVLLLFSTRPDPRRQLLLCMIGLGLTFTVLVEIVVLKGDISRMNTVFKFYLQVWVLWAVASAAVLPELATWLRTEPRQKRLPAPGGQRRWVSAWAGHWWGAFGVLLAACLLYPLTAAPVRMGDRFENSRSSTIDGAAYMRTSVYYDDGRPVTLDWDRQAFDWLRRNVRGIPTVLEASTPFYRWGSRVSIYTGLPTVIGWDWHQKQQRSVLPGQIIDQRIQDVNTIYTSTDLDQTVQLLNRYGVRYIYVGPLEQIYYAGDGLDKFGQVNDLWALVYQNAQVKIYQVR